MFGLINHRVPPGVCRNNSADTFRFHRDSGRLEGAVRYEVSRKPPQGCRDGDELGGPVPAVPRPKPNVVTFLAGDDAEAVMLKLMQPAVAAPLPLLLPPPPSPPGRDRRGPAGRSGCNKAARVWSGEVARSARRVATSKDRCL